MNNSPLFDELISKLEDNLTFLEDKPEETAETTLYALWHLSCGKSLSAKKATQYSLPELNSSQVSTLHDLIAKRISGVPLAHLTQRQDFFGIELITDKRALIPRKETELLAKTAINFSKTISSEEKSTTVIDACCGSGNLAIALAINNPSAEVYACDLSEEALDLSFENIKKHQLENRIHLKKSDVLSDFMTEQFIEKVDLIMCNPPYISTMKVQKMDSEIASYEPSLAFDGGMMGIKVIQKLIREAAVLLKPYAHLVFEVGLGQGSFIMQMIEKTGLYSKIQSHTDSQGNIRVVSACN